MAQNLQDPAQQARYPEAHRYWGVKPTHIITFITVCGFIAAALVYEQPWNPNVAIAFLLITVLSGQILLRKPSTLIVFAILTLALGILFIAHLVPLHLRTYQMVAWGSYCVLLYIVCNRSLEHSPGFTQAIGSFLIAAAVAVGAGVFVLQGIYHWHMWSVLSASFLIGTMLYQLLTDLFN